MTKMKAARDNAARSKLQHALTNTISDPDHRRRKKLSILLRLGGGMQDGSRLQGNPKP